MKEVGGYIRPQRHSKPRVIINEDPKAHISNLKPIPSTREVVDKCMECDSVKDTVLPRTTLSPRQRAVVFREIEISKEPERSLIVPLKCRNSSAMQENRLVLPTLCATLIAL